jgi:NAD(P)-dependent dehydrogenase (short-subunit alcohol dehydrogenase family)
MSPKGSIDILINNAGIKHKSNLIETSEELWNRVLAVNLTNVFTCCKAVLPHVIAQKKGKVINICSTVAKSGISGSCAHTAAKGAIPALTRMLAWELAGKNINMNAIAPGWVAVETSTPKLRGPEAKAKAQSLNPVGRIGNPRDIAHAPVYLARDESDYVDGAILDVDGGWLSGKGF